MEINDLSIHLPDYSTEASISEDSSFNKTCLISHEKFTHLANAIRREITSLNGRISQV